MLHPWSSYSSSCYLCFGYGRYAMLKRLASLCYSSGTHRLHRCVQQLQPTAVETVIEGPNPPQLAEMPSPMRGTPLMPLNMMPEEVKGGPGHHQSRAYAYQAS